MKTDCTDKIREHLNNIRPLAHQWLRSEEGRKKQSESVKKTWKTRKKILMACMQCEKSYETYMSWSKFCCRRCCMRYNRGYIGP